MDVALDESRSGTAANWENARKSAMHGMLRPPPNSEPRMELHISGLNLQFRGFSVPTEQILTVVATPASNQSHRTAIDSSPNSRQSPPPPTDGADENDPAEYGNPATMRASSASSADVTRRRAQGAGTPPGSVAASERMVRACAPFAKAAQAPMDADAHRERSPGILHSNHSLR